MTAMGWSLNETLGILHRFWWWCVDYAENGDLRKHNDAIIGHAVGLNGDQAKQFVQGMLEAGWLDQEPYFRLHDWWDYIGLFLQRKYGDRKKEKWQTVQELYSNNTAQCTIIDATKPNLTKPNQKHKGRHFVPPTLTEVKNYCQERKNDVDPVKFHAFYEANGWVQGRGKPIKDWRAAVRTWEKPRSEFSAPQKRPAKLLALEYRALKWDNQAIKTTLLLKNYPEHEIDEALGVG